MSSPVTGQHADGGARTNEPSAAELTFAERVRTLLHFGRTGSLATHSRRQQGYPYGSVMPYGIDRAGRPVFLISTMAMHTQNLHANPRASLLVTDPNAAGDPLAASRVTLLGNVYPVPESDASETRKLYLELHPNSKSWADFRDFSFYRMDVVDIYYVGGFGVMGWVPAPEYNVAQPDPLVDAAAGIIQHMNADHGDAMILIAKKYAGIEASEASMTAVDHLGFQVRLKTPGGTRDARIAFSREANSPMDARKVLVEMTANARQ